MVNIVKEAPYIEEQDACFEARGMCCLYVVDEGDACIEAGRVHASPELVSRDKFVCNDVVLHAFSNCLLHEFAHGFE